MENIGISETYSPPLMSYLNSKSTNEEGEGSNSLHQSNEIPNSDDEKNEDGGNIYSDDEKDDDGNDNSYDEKDDDDDNNSDEEENEGGGNIYSDVEKDDDGNNNSYDEKYDDDDKNTDEEKEEDGNDIEEIDEADDSGSEPTQTNSSCNTVVNDTFVPTSVIGRILSHEEKLSLMKMKPCHPSNEVFASRKKTIGSVERCCSKQLFTRRDGTNRSWLTYSLEKDALFCIPCILFSDRASRGENQRQNQGTAFVSAGFSNWKKQHEKVDKHETSRSHVEAKISEALFMQEKTLIDITSKEEKHEKERRKREVEVNRNILMRIVDTILLLGTQEHAFRGHNESLASDPSVNVGNFLETLKYLSKYDKVMADHLEKVKIEHEKNMQKLSERKKQTKKGDKLLRPGRGSKLTFLSDNIQNKIIEIIGKEIVRKLVEMIDDCLAWAIIADTTPDVTKHEQLSLCVRIVGKSGEISEHLLFCLRASSTTGVELFDAIKTALEERNVPFNNCVAQTYDGASNMSGKYQGLQTRIKEYVGEHVIFTHCYAHSLNLVLSDTACVSLDISKLFEKLEVLYVFFSKSQPIHELFEENQKKFGLPCLSIKRVNTVRWSSREHCLEIFLKRYDAILVTLESISKNKDFDANKRCVADGLIENFCQKQFIASAYLFREVFASTGPLSRVLQSVNIDFGKALTLIDTAYEQLLRLRQNPSNIIEAVENDFDLEWAERRIVRRKRMPGELAVDEPPVTAKDAWLRDVFFTAIDSIVQGLNNRFSNSRHVLEAFAIFSPTGFRSFLKDYPTANHVEEKIRKFCQSYSIDSFRCADELISFSTAFGKFNLQLIRNEQCHTDSNIEESDESGAENDEEDEEESASNQGTFIDCLAILNRYKLVDAYPTLCRVYAIAVAIPVTSASAESSFSTLKRVKTRLRTKMLQKRLESLLLMSIERKILLNLDTESIITLLGKTTDELKKALIQ